MEQEKKYISEDIQGQLALTHTDLCKFLSLMA